MDDQIAKAAEDSEREARSAPPVPKKLLDDALKVRVVHRQPEVEKPLPPESVVPPMPEPPARTVDVPDDDDSLIADLPPAEPVEEKPKAEKGKRGGFFAGYCQHKLWTLPLTVFAALLISGAAVMAAPTTRYMVLARFITRSFTVSVTDSTTGSPVTGAVVTLDGQSKTTDSAGKVTVAVPVGQATVTVRKTYYKSASQSVLVDLATSGNVVTVRLVATGRQVPVKVINKITGKPIPEAVITVGNANAKTDLNGLATIVLPAAPAAQSAALTVDGYNNLSAEVQVTTQAVGANTFAMVPAGHVYFLSNLSGKIDVVSTNLDGTDRTTMLAGTGSEDTSNTVLLASRDWQYLMLLSKRSGGDSPKLYLINTANNKLSTVDGTAADFTLIGWSGHAFFYQLSRPDLPAWQPGATSIVSYSADSGKSTTIVSSSAMGTSNADAQYETIWQTAIVSGNLVYAKTWYKYPGYVVGVAGQQNVLVSVKPDGTGAKTLKSIDASQYYMSSFRLAKPDQLYFAVYDNNSSNPNYYRLDGSGNITQSSTITNDSVNQNYPTYLISPSSTETFWSESRDGKNTLFVGDSSGNSGGQIATLSEYAPYGWFSDSYLLVQKGGSELYIMPVAGGTPLKISDYYKPQNSLYGYGGGYGGL